MGICGLCTIIKFTSKKHKISKIWYFQVAWHCLKSLYIYPNQQYIVSTDTKQQIHVKTALSIGFLKTLILTLCTLLYYCVLGRSMQCSVRSSRTEQNVCPVPTPQAALCRRELTLVLLLLLKNFCALTLEFGANLQYTSNTCYKLRHYWRKQQNRTAYRKTTSNISWSI